jgi:hypothetical protein
MATILEALHDVVAGCTMAAVLAGLDDLNQDHNEASMIRRHGVLVTGTRKEDRALHAVNVEPTDWLNDNLWIAWL